MYYCIITRIAKLDLALMMIDLEKIQNLFIEGKYEKVLKIVDEKLLVEKNNISLLNIKGMVHSIKKEYDDSIVYFKKCILLDDTKSSVYSNLAYSFIGLKDDEKAIENFILSIKINEKDLKILLSLSELFIIKSDFKSARTYLNKALKLEPNNPITIGLLASSYVNTNKNKTIFYLKKLVDLDKENMKYLNSLARAYMDNKDFENAKICFSSYIDCNNHDLNALNNLAVCHLSLNESIEAQTVLQLIIEKDANYYQAWGGLAILAIDEEKYNDALEMLMWADSLEPNNLKILHSIVNVYQLMGNKSMMRSYIEKAFDVDESNYKTLCLAADYSVSNLEFDTAESFYQKALSQEKDGFWALAGLGYLYSISDKHELAIEFLNKSLVIEPELQSAKDTLAGIYKKDKNYSKALNFYKKAKQLGWEENVLECLYLSEKYKEFEDFYSKNEEILKFSRLGSGILNHASYHIDIPDMTSFCKHPLDYIHYKDVTGIDKLPNFNERLLKEFYKQKMNSVHRNQSLLINGTQSLINIFEQGSDLFKTFETFLIGEIDNYKSIFINSNDIFIKNWPSKFKLSGWVVEMNNDGFLSTHNHPNGWISGVYYVKIPKKIPTHEANIKFCLPGRDFPHSLKNFPEKEVESIESRLILFPSSSHHYTSPYSDGDGRISISFDFEPINSTFK